MRPVGVPGGEPLVQISGLGVHLRLSRPAGAGRAELVLELSLVAAATAASFWLEEALGDGSEPFASEFRPWLAKVTGQSP